MIEELQVPYESNQIPEFQEHNMEGVPHLVENNVPMLEDVIANKMPIITLDLNHILTGHMYMSEDTGHLSKDLDTTKTPLSVNNTHTPLAQISPTPKHKHKPFLPPPP